MPGWVPYMVLACIAALVWGWIVAWAVDHWRDW